jgi:hypothetical protein
MRLGTRFGAFALAAALTAGGAAWAPHAQATTASGTAVVSCTAVFGHVPATTWTPGGTCAGTGNIVADGVADNGAPYALAGSGAFFAGFSYYEPCLAGPQPAFVLSFATGTFTLGPVPVLSGPGTSATISGNFTWDRVGLNPVISMSGLTALFDTGVTATGGDGLGTATFVPPGTFNTATQLQCSGGGEPLTIPVEIAAAVTV